MEGEQNQEDTNTNSDRIMFTTKKKGKRVNKLLILIIMKLEKRWIVIVVKRWIVIVVKKTHKKKKNENKSKIKEKHKVENGEDRKSQKFQTCYGYNQSQNKNKPTSGKKYNFTEEYFDYALSFNLHFLNSSNL